MPVTVCKHTPTLTEKALYWTHVIWNHTPDFEFIAGQNQVVRACLLVDWIDGLSEYCPECIPAQEVHLHHREGECDD